MLHQSGRAKISNSYTFLKHYSKFTFRQFYKGFYGKFIGGSGKQPLILLVDDIMLKFCRNEFNRITIKS